MTYYSNNIKYFVFLLWNNEMIMTVRVGFCFDSYDFYISVSNSYVSVEANSKISLRPTSESSVDKNERLKETYL